MAVPAPPMAKMRMCECVLDAGTSGCGVGSCRSSVVIVNFQSGRVGALRPPDAAARRPHQPFLDQHYFCQLIHFQRRRKISLKVFLMSSVKFDLFARTLCLNEPNFTRPMAVPNSGWSSADLRPLIELVLPSDA